MTTLVALLVSAGVVLTAVAFCWGWWRGYGDGFRDAYKAERKGRI